MAKKTLKYRTIKRLNSNFHFFASSAATWKVGENLDEIIEFMKKDGMPFNLYYVPLPVKADYEISMYMPKVDGIKYIGFYGFEDIVE